MDERLLGLAKRDHLAAPRVVKDMPEGAGWLMVRFGGDTEDEADRRARSLIEDLENGPNPPRCTFVHDPREEERLWKVREAGLGATAYPPGRADTHEGWEDAAVPPDRLGDYLRDFRALIEEFGYGPTRSPTTVRAVAQPHCHQHAVMGFGADQRVLARAGVDVRTLDAGEGTAVLADGFSCRTQIEAGTAARPRHLADLLPDEEGR